MAGLGLRVPTAIRPTAASSRNGRPNPPKGYPTLSSANLAPTKAAIARYTAIVAHGGWRPLPDMKLQPGATIRPSALLRERLHGVGRTEGECALAKLRLLR